MHARNTFFRWKVAVRCTFLNMLSAHGRKLRRFLVLPANLKIMFSCILLSDEGLDGFHSFYAHECIVGQTCTILSTNFDSKDYRQFTDILDAGECTTIVASGLRLRRLSLFLRRYSKSS